jgi:hypothetical protein
MKGNTVKKLFVALGIIVTCSVPLFAIENLTLSLQCSNVVLSWPGTVGDTYFVRCRPDLSTNSTWALLTNSYPAADGTNLTVFVHSNVVAHPDCSSRGSAAAMFSPSSRTAWTPAEIAALKQSLRTNPPPVPWDLKHSPKGRSGAATLASSGGSSGGFSPDATAPAAHHPTRIRTWLFMKS